MDVAWSVIATTLGSVGILWLGYLLAKHLCHEESTESHGSHAAGSPSPLPRPVPMPAGPSRMRSLTNHRK